MEKLHSYKATIEWTGNNGTCTDHYKNYERSHTIKIENKATIQGSSDVVFRGDKTKHNPEDLLVSAISSCHLLWYLHLCAINGVVILEYTDNVIGTMLETPNGSGYFTEVILNPTIQVSNINMIEHAIKLHHKAHEFCFIAKSVNFPVKIQPIISAIKQ